MNIRKAARVVTQHFDRALQPVGLRGTQFTILVVLARTGATPISKLAELLVMDRTTLTRNLRPLQRDGLIDIQRGKDRRTRYWTLLPKGKERLMQALPLWQNAQRHFVLGLGETSFRKLLDRLSETVTLAS